MPLLPFNGLLKSPRDDGLIRRGVRPDALVRRARLAPTMQGAQKLRREAHLQVRRNDSPC